MQSKELSSEFLAFQAQCLTPKIDRVKGPPRFTERSMQEVVALRFPFVALLALSSSFVRHHLEAKGRWWMENVPRGRFGRAVQLAPTAPRRSGPSPSPSMA